jgi:DNA polymerase III alpha subunit (gram-positive type)
VLCRETVPEADDGQVMSTTNGTCPNCTQGDLITISMNVSGRDLSFTTCHFCEAKWWHRDGHEVPLRSVITQVAEKS